MSGAGPNVRRIRNPAPILLAPEHIDVVAQPASSSWRILQLQTVLSDHGPQLTYLVSLRLVVVAL
jgi:hypothetical protein